MKTSDKIDDKYENKIERNFRSERETKKIVVYFWSAAEFLSKIVINYHHSSKKFTPKLQ